MVSSLINVVEEECLCLCKISINVNKLLTVLLSPAYLFIRFLYTLLLYNNNCSINLYNRDLQTKFILFTTSVHTRLLSELPLLALSLVFSIAMVSNLMNAVEGEYLCLHEISINVNKLLAVLLLPVYPLFYTRLCCCLFTS